MLLVPESKRSVRAWPPPERVSGLRMHLARHWLSTTATASVGSVRRKHCSWPSAAKRGVTARGCRIFTWQRSSHSRGGPSPDQQWRALACDLDVRRCCLDRNSHVARLASNCVGCSPRPLHGLVRRRISAARPMGV